MTIEFDWMARKILRIEMLLDSFVQQKNPDKRKVAQALAHTRAIRNRIRKEYGWQWTLTSPSKLTPSRGLTKEDRIRIFGYDEPKRWGYERQVDVEEEGTKSVKKAERLIA